MKPFPRIQVDFALSNREDDNLLKASSPIQFTLLPAAEEIRWVGHCNCIELELVCLCSSAEIILHTFSMLSELFMLICIHVHNYVIVWALVKHLVVNVKPIENSEVLSLLDENVVSAAVSPHLYVLSYIQVRCYLPFWQLHSNFRNFSNGLNNNNNNLFYIAPQQQLYELLALYRSTLGYVLKITIAKSDPDMELLGNMLL